VAPLGLLTLQAATRTRIRINGTASWTEHGIALDVAEVSCSTVGAAPPVTRARSRS
jgi:hypothetical protein